MSVQREDELVGFCADFLDEVVSFGRQIIAWSVEVADGDPKHLPSVSSLHHIVELFDSVAVLMRH